MKKILMAALGLMLALTAVSCGQGAKDYDWKKGVVTDEFVFQKAPFAECHAATIAETPAGLVVAYFGGTKERNPDVCIWVSRLVDGKWIGPEMAADGIQNPELRYPCWNPVLYQIPGKELLLFYKVGPSPSTWKGYLKRSFDNGQTWSEAEELPEGIVGPVKNKPEEINGMLVCPSSKEGDGWRLFMEMTPDYGKTWTSVGPLNEKEPWLAIQPSILKHQNGDLQILFRTRNRRVGTAWSKDGGMTWSKLDSTSLPNNNSGTDAVTLQDGRHLLVYNHVLPPDEQAKGPRTPLNVALSKDGKKWYASVVLEDSPISQYSYPAVIQGADGFIHIVYTWRRQGVKYVKLDPAELQMVPIKNLTWPGLSSPTPDVTVTEPDFQISVCDWMLLKRQKDGAVTLAKELNYDGLEVDMNSLSKNPTFLSRFKNNPEELMNYKRLAAMTGIKISSVAMSGFYAQSFALRDSYIEPVQDCIDVMKGLGVKVCFLPLGVTSDIAAHPELRPAAVERLRTVAKLAEKANVIIGIETTLDAAGDLALLKDIGSPAVKIYFNFQNPLRAGRDLHQELRTLGAENICMIHCTNTDKVWLENDPEIDMPAVKKTLEDMGWKGWLVVERSRDASQSRNVKANYGANCAFLKKVFQGAE